MNLAVKDGDITDEEEQKMQLLVSPHNSIYSGKPLNPDIKMIASRNSMMKYFKLLF